MTAYNVEEVERLTHPGEDITYDGNKSLQEVPVEPNGNQSVPTITKKWLICSSNLA